ncbi:hypothetical protein [Lentzea sp. NPDC059081]|uniref:hypothetical protein n=1 Tax=Lentzea sp. NPDC059081 TaxID=3346719 RepID=UPI0036A8CD13
MTTKSSEPQSSARTTRSSSLPERRGNDRHAREAVTAHPFDREQVAIEDHQLAGRFPAVAPNP